MDTFFAFQRLNDDARLFIRKSRSYNGADTCRNMPYNFYIAACNQYSAEYLPIYL